MKDERGRQGRGRFMRGRPGLPGLLAGGLAAVSLAWLSNVGADALLPEGFVDAGLLIPSIVLDMRYHGVHNFVGEPIDGYDAPRCILTRQAAEALQRVQADLSAFSLSLKVYDCYRPQRAVNHFVRWARDLDDTRTRGEFYPEVSKRNLFRDGYIAGKSGHSRGSTVDLTLVPLPLPEEEPYRPGDPLRACHLPAQERFGDNSIDMGTGFDCFHPLSATRNESLAPGPRAHRLLLKTLMEKHGFRNYQKEWWHYTLTDEPFPETYFDFVIPPAEPAVKKH